MAGTYVRPHENVRLAVSKHVLELTRSVLRRLEQHSQGLDRFRIKKLIEFIESTEHLSIIMPQEVGVEGGFVDMDLFGRVIFEFKGDKREFKDGLNKIREKYLPYYPNALYVVITNNDYWEIYRVEKGSLGLVASGGRDRVDWVLEKIIEDVLEKEGYRIPPRPDAISSLFKDLVSYEDKLMKVFIKIHSNESIKPLYESFKTMIETLYSEADEEFIKRLFVKHTILQMIVLASLSRVLEKTMDPIEMCSGVRLDVEVALPYLNWWFIAYNKLRDKLDESDVKLIEELAGEVATRVNMIDWSIGYPEDVFREFYELFIDPETRRKIGEYYTPLWVVEFIIRRVKQLSGGLRGRIVLDPFCGSGTFLVMAFYEKIKEGASPDEALKEVIGYDANPLAVSIARAELVLAYTRVKKSIGVKREVPSPLVFHTDTLYTMFRQGVPFKSGGKKKSSILSYTETERSVGLERLWKIMENIVTTITLAIDDKVREEIRRRAGENLSALLQIEHALGNILRIALKRCEGTRGGVRECLKNNVKEGLEEDLFKHSVLDYTVVGRLFKEHVHRNIEEFSGNLAELLEMYGNGVWATSILSILAPAIIKHINADIIMTNPPWLQLTRFKTSYAENLRDKSREVLEKVLGARGVKGVNSIIQGSDLSSLALYGALTMSRSTVAFVMPREASFHAKTSQMSGILLTYSVIKSFENFIDYVEIIDLDYDAFQHGNVPALVFIKLEKDTSRAKEGVKTLNSKLLKADVKMAGEGRYSKSLRLSTGGISIDLEDYHKNYEEYVKPLIGYYLVDPASLKQALQVEKIVKMGDYIRGIFGGEAKKGKKRYAGLTITGMRSDETGNEYIVRFSEMKQDVHVPQHLLRKYRADFFKLIYIGCIHPFNVSCMYDILLSRMNEDNLKKLLSEVLTINENKLTASEVDKLKMLVDELVQPSSIKTLKPGNAYVIYRCSRTFSAVVFIPDAENYIAHSTVAYIDCGKMREKAYFYASALNYLAYKAIKTGRSFVRDQYARPVNALVDADLTWTSFEERDREALLRIVDLSKRLHTIAPQKFSRKEYNVEKEAFRDLENLEEFNELVKLFDNYVKKHVGEERLEKALSWFSKL